MPEAPVIPASEWHVITCEYPPTVGGVSDHTMALATALAATAAVHVWCPSKPVEPRALPHVVVHPELRTFGPTELRHLGRQLNIVPRPRRLFVQWVPQGFGYRSLNLWFALWLAVRGWLRGDELHLMVHEPFLSDVAHPRQIVAAVVHRLMLALAASGAFRVWLSTPSWEKRVRPYILGATPEWLPVPVSPAFLEGEDDAYQSGAAGLTVGHFGTYSSLVTPMLTEALDCVLQQSSARVLLIGHKGDAFRELFLATRSQFSARVTATGSLEPREIARHIRRCDLLVEPYPDGVTARRTSTVTLLALGKPVVTNSGHLTEPFWAQSGGLHLVDEVEGRRIGEAVVQLLADGERRIRLATEARALYERVFDAEHLLAALADPTTSTRHPSDADLRGAGSPALR